MNDDLSERFRSLTDAIPIPYPWDTIEYVNRVATYRGKPITLWPIDPGSLVGTGCGTGSGLWIERDQDDVIMYGGQTPWHADHIIAHELGHMLLGHGVTPDEAASTVAELPLSDLMPALSPDTICSVLRRQDYGSDRERDAEAFADLLLVEAMLPKRPLLGPRSTFFRYRRR